MMTVQTAPTWFALQILLQGVQHRKDAASKASYWSCLLTPGESLLCRLEAELSKSYSELKNPPPVDQDVKDFAAQLLSLRDSQLSGAALTMFEESARKALELVSKQLGTWNSWA